MKNNNYPKDVGNCLIYRDEAISLSKDIIKKYNSLFSGETINLTKYPANYTELKESIYEKTRTVISEKTIIKLLLAKQNSCECFRFHYSVLNTFYIYAYGMTRDEYLANGKSYFDPNRELFYNEFQIWKYSKYNYIPTIQDFSRFYLIGIDENLPDEENQFLLLSAVYYGHASFHCFIDKLLNTESTIFLLYKFAKINGGLGVKWRAGYLISLFPDNMLHPFIFSIQDYDTNFKEAVLQHKVTEYLENLKISEPSYSLFISQVLFQIYNKDIFDYRNNLFFCQQ